MAAKPQNTLLLVFSYELIDEKVLLVNYNGLKQQPGFAAECSEEENNGMRAGRCRGVTLEGFRGGSHNLISAGKFGFMGMDTLPFEAEICISHPTSVPRGSAWEPHPA